jgi:hypothetical protein
MVFAFRPESRSHSTGFPTGHRFELFAGALMIFWLAAINAARRLERSSGR